MAKQSEDKGLLLMVTSDGMGQSDAELRHKLITTYFKLLTENDVLPGAICFYTEGVRLVVEGSPVIEELKDLEARGVPLIVCQTCLNYYGLTGKELVGIVGGMTDIIAAQWKADKVITI